MKYDFCKGDVLASFKTREDAMKWTKEHGYIWLYGFSASSAIDGEQIEFFADPNDLPDLMTIADIEGNEEKILDYYGYGYEPCIYPKEN